MNPLINRDFMVNTDVRARAILNASLAKAREDGREVTYEAMGFAWEAVAHALEMVLKGDAEIVALRAERDSLREYIATGPAPVTIITRIS